MRQPLGYAAATIAGPVRALNEDCIGAEGAILSDGRSASTAGVVNAGLDTLFVVADGMGGHPFGGLASSLVVANLVADPPRLEEESCALVVRRANLDLHDVMRRRPETMSMGAVLAGVVIRGRSTCWFNVGDSRVYHSRADGAFVQLSVDDVSLMRSSTGARMVSAGLGGRRLIAPITPHTGLIDLVCGDRLLLCSDGVTASLSDETMSAIIKSSRSPVTAVDDLLDTCHRRGATDNLSVVVLGRFD